MPNNIDAKPRERDVSMTSMVEITPGDDSPGLTDQELIEDAIKQAQDITREEVNAQIIKLLEDGAWAIEVAMFHGVKVSIDTTRDRSLDRAKPIRVRLTDLRRVRMTVLPVHCDCGKHANGKVSLWQ